jgi:hypothetical protein
MTDRAATWTLVITAPGRPTRSLRIGRARVYGSLLAALAATATSLWLGWQLGEVTRLL